MMPVGPTGLRGDGHPAPDGFDVRSGQPARDRRAARPVRARPVL